MPMWLIIIIIMVVNILLWFIGTYNSLTLLRNKVKNQWTQVDVQLKRKFDLIPNLIETVKGYAKYENLALEDIVKIRNTYTLDSTIEEIEELTRCLSKLMMLIESCPKLKGNDNFLSLQNDLKNSENKIIMMCQLYNDTITKYNHKVETISSNIVASMCYFKSLQCKFLEGKVNL